MKIIKENKLKIRDKKLRSTINLKKTDTIDETNQIQGWQKNHDGM
jgi:hypothetical protein